jgi:hypothetical protein
MKKTILISIILLFIAASDMSACTTAVISGKYTKDGRPLLWKHRDTWFVKNKIMQFDDGKYPYTGLVNSLDTAGSSIWIGYNSTGFGIMNSASYNLNNDTITQSGLEGRLMKEALQTCANVDEFEQFLLDMPEPRRLEANFGVIDGNGGAAYFELGNYKVIKIDANDPIIAPNGYVIRTNYSFNGIAGEGGGYIRYVTANKVLDEAVKSNELSAQTIIQKASRNLTHSLTEDNLWDYENLKAGESQMVFFMDYIPRSGSSSSCVVEGVKPGENPNLSTMWTVLGWPLASVTIPVFINKNADIPDVLTYNEEIGDAPLCNFALTLKDECYSQKWGTSKKYYLDVNKLLNVDGTGIMQQNIALDNALFDQSYDLLNRWREEGMSEQELSEFYKNVDNQVKMHYSTTYGLSVD